MKFLVTHENKKPKRWHANMYMISQKNYNHLFATKHMWKAEKIKEITYPRKGTFVCKHLFFTYPAVLFFFFFRKISKIEYTLWYEELRSILQQYPLFRSNVTGKPAKLNVAKFGYSKILGGIVELQWLEHFWDLKSCSRHEEFVLSRVQHNNYFFNLLLD